VNGNALMHTTAAACHTCTDTVPTDSIIIINEIFNVA